MKEILGKEVKEIIKDRKLLASIDCLGIANIAELCNYSRMELNEKGLTNSSVNDIRIALQLNGIDLKPNHARKNSLLTK